MKRRTKRDVIGPRRVRPCGAIDGQPVCNDIQVCARCGHCLLHCECMAASHIQPGAATLEGEELILCDRPAFTWKGAVEGAGENSRRVSRKRKRA
jgi:hypothetical protein